MQGTSFAFVGVLAGISATQGLGVALTACLIGGIIHFILGGFIKHLRFMFPPLVTGLVILAIGLYLIPVAIKYAAGGAANFQMEAASFGSMMHWFAALTVVVVSLVCKFMGTRISFKCSNFDRPCCRLCCGLGAMGMVNFGAVAKAGFFQIPTAFPVWLRI